MKVVVWIPGRPVPLARGRAFWDERRGGVRVTDPKKNHAFRDRIGWYVKPLLKGGDLHAGPVSVKITVCVKGVRGDLDNYVKAVLDACNRVAWADDRQVMQIFAEFRACETEGQGIGLTIEEMAPAGPGAAS